MSGNINNRVYFACLGVAKCNSGLLSGVISTELGLTRKINNIFSPGSSNPVTTYSDIADVDFSYTSYLDTFISISNEDGINNFVGFDMAIGLDYNNATKQGFAGLFSGASSLISGAVGSPPHSAIRSSMSSLVSLTYSFPVDGFFTVTRNYKGFSKKASTPPGSFSESQKSVKRRQCFVGQLPTNISNNAIQNIEVNYSFNRTPVPEFATRRPYANYITFPIETTVTFDMLTQKLDSYNDFDAFQSACKTKSPAGEDLTITVTGAGSLSIKNAYLTDLKYSGGSANSNDNQTISATYTSYETISGIEPIIFSLKDDPCG